MSADTTESSQSESMSPSPAVIEIIGTAHRNFRHWYVRILSQLYQDKDAGFPILMITLPLLERYLRGRSDNFLQCELTQKYHSEMVLLFPEICSIERSRDFWKIYRHGVLHQASMNTISNRSPACLICAGYLTNDIKLLEIDRNGHFWLNPRAFSERAISAIEDNFHFFEAQDNGAQPFPTVIYNPTISITAGTTSFTVPLSRPANNK